MPARDEKCRFKKNDKISITFPSFWIIIKIIIISIILYPWYYALAKKRSFDKAMNYIFQINVIDNVTPTPAKNPA